MRQLLVLASGVTIVVGSLALVSIPVAGVVAGLSVSVFALLWNFGGEQ